MKATIVILSIATLLALGYGTWGVLSGNEGLSGIGWFIGGSACVRWAFTGVFAAVEKTP